MFTYRFTPKAEKAPTTSIEVDERDDSLAFDRAQALANEHNSRVDVIFGHADGVVDLGSCEPLEIKFDTREAWFVAFVEASRPLFEEAGSPLPATIRVSLGFPSAGIRSKVIGECWSTIASKDGHNEIFLHPGLESDSRIADILTHELVHAAVGHEAKHGPKFKKCATALGLTGKMTATIAGPKWRELHLPILRELGRLPYGQLNGLMSTRKKQGTRMIKCSCDSCEMVFRTTRKHIESVDPDLGMRCPIPTCDGMINVEGMDD